MYYAIIVLSTLLFGGCFAINDSFRKLKGSGIESSLKFSFLGAAAGIVVLIAVNGFSIDFTWFTLIMALANAVNGFLFTYVGFKALGCINLSLYSLYSMLGGMFLPFLQGIIFFGERLTLAKIICFIFIVAALSLTLDGDRKKGGTIYYIGIFVLNGLSGVLSKIFTEASYPKTNASVYSLLTAVCTFIINGVILAVFFRKKEKNAISPLAVCLGLGGGALNNVANFLLVIALMHVDASCQYPLVTGGVIIVSTIISYLKKDKPSKKEIISVILAFVGMLAIFVIPI